MEYIDRFGLLGPQMTLGHGVWLNKRDIQRLAETGTCVCHNCSSNFRLRSGVVALNKLEAAGITSAVGIDEEGINDHRDMLQEMRMVLRVHRVPGMDDEVPTPAQVFRMATSDGAATTTFADTIGALEVGRAADMVLINWRDISYPYLDAETPLLDAPAARQDQRCANSDIRRRRHLSRRPVHQSRPRRRASGVARGPAMSTLRRRGGTPPPLQVTAAADAGILCQLLRSGTARAVLSAESRQ